MGVDSAPEMIAKAQAAAGGVAYEVGDVLDYVPGEQVDVIVTNAMLQWVAGHDEVLRELGASRAGGSPCRCPETTTRRAHWPCARCASPRAGPRAVGRCQQLPPGRRRRPLWTAAARRGMRRWTPGRPPTSISCPVIQGQRHPVLHLDERHGHAPDPGGARRHAVGGLLRRARRELWQLYPPHGSVVDFPFRRVFAVAF